MPASSLDHLSRWMHRGVGVLLLGLVVFAVVSVRLPGALALLVVLAGGVGVFAGYALAQRRLPVAIWLPVMMVSWLVMLAVSPAASYLAFPLFLIQVHALALGPGLAAVAVTLVAAIAGLSRQQGRLTTGMVMGPLLGAAVAVAMVLALETLGKESDRRQALLDELEETREDLLAAERRAGQHEERERVAAEIHDTVAQGLTSVQLLLATAARVIDQQPEVAAGLLEQAREATASNLAETRRLVASMAPADLERASLRGALQRLVDASCAPGRQVTLDWGEVPELPVSSQVVLLRVAQSALANVVQHADARTATVRVAPSAAGVRLEVADDGRGFDPDTALSEGGFGLGLMRRRAERAGGRLAVASSPRGTTVTAEVPLTAAD